MPAKHQLDCLENRRRIGPLIVGEAADANPVTALGVRVSTWSDSNEKHLVFSAKTSIDGEHYDYSVTISTGIQLSCPLVNDGIDFWLALPEKHLKLIPAIHNLPEEISLSGTISAIAHSYLSSLRRFAPSIEISSEGQVVKTTILFLYYIIDHLNDRLVFMDLSGEIPKEIPGIIEYINKNISNASLRADVICNEAGVSRRMLYRLFSSSNGVGTYIRNKRLDKSIILLVCSTANVNDVAYEVGFNDPATFRSAFKRRFGQPPSHVHRDKAKTSLPTQDLRWVLPQHAESPGSKL